MKFIQPDWPAPECIRAYTTLKTGWGNPGASSKDSALRNQLSLLLPLPNPPIWLNQTHSTLVVDATPEQLDVTADASFTDKINQVCIVLTADCLPILLCHEDGTAVAAIHAGWRGLANGIVEETVAAMRQPPEKLLAWLGPAIGPTKFEVGEDVLNAFVNQDEEAIKAFLPHTKGKWMANLYLLAQQRLQKINIHRIYGGKFCTYSDSDHFYSYRREQQNAGRLATVIWINDSSI